MTSVAGFFLENTLYSQVSRLLFHLVIPQGFQHYVPATAQIVMSGHFKMYMGVCDVYQILLRQLERNPTVTDSHQTDVSSGMKFHWR